MLEIKMLFGNWKEATKEQVEKFFDTWRAGATNIPAAKKREYFNEHHIRGGHIMLNGKAETTEEQKERVFRCYKNRLKDSVIRFNVIEYLCNCPKINPYIMAAVLIKEGTKILYDDSSISKAENTKKENQVKRLLK